MFTALHVEWAKAKARADRWEEEVILLDEEMRRVLVFCQWKESWWMEQAPLRQGLSRALEEGLQAYAGEQADMEKQIRISWTAKWARARELAEPILLVAFGVAPVQGLVEGSSDLIELDIEDEDDGGGGGSDYE